MRFSTIVSLLIAILLAGAAVYGAQTWLSTERAQLMSLLQQQQSAPQEEAPKDTIVVASEPIQFGELINSTNVREIEWSGSLKPDGHFVKIEDLVIGESDETARFALTSIAIGEPVLTSKVTIPGQRAKLSTALAPGKKAVSIRVNDVLGVAGFVLPGDRVDVLLTRGNFVDVLLQGVKVLAIDQKSDERQDNPSVVRTVTFEVNTEEAQKLVLGAQVGTLSLTLRNLASTDIERSERITINDLDELDFADDLVQGQNQEEEPAEPVIDPSVARLDELEKLLKDLSEGVSEKISVVEEKLDKEPVIQEVVKEVVVEKPPIIPEKSTVGVIRNGQRNEYKVNRSDEEAEDSAELEEQVTQ
ncbi:Flp pilus assembly protein CpaB [Aestuariicoccus sp. MJ-SS9]|uniref:Flp pilus assembly protein CpaB n=1 Tax=Aestuariicoccus sp. MJ-SS9 TaxID=3079855 RepID=UPI00290C2ABF|nr:Flp pilus assembly protein CpaB [Aestuariicoccus sp. MJ-SS9]MDU8913271.1 Flp pilus assembly protein CpaB [Aestuariicoccus sp. MJ-SS9]